MLSNEHVGRVLLWSSVTCWVRPNISKTALSSSMRLSLATSTCIQVTCYNKTVEFSAHSWNGFSKIINKTVLWWRVISHISYAHFFLAFFWMTHNENSVFQAQKCSEVEDIQSKPQYMWLSHVLDKNIKSRLWEEIMIYCDICFTEETTFLLDWMLTVPL